MKEALLKLLKNYKLNHISSSWQKSHEEELVNLKQQKVELQTILIFQEHPPVKKSFKERSKFYKITPQVYVSKLDEEVNRKLMNENNSLCRQWDEKLKKQKIDSSHKSYGKKLDEEVAKTRKQFKKELYTQVLNEHAFFRLLDKDPTLESQEDDVIEEKISEFLKDKINLRKVHREITSSRKGYEYERIFDHQVEPELLPFLQNGFNIWTQVYLMINHDSKTINYSIGKSRGSSCRQDHGYYAHTFAQMKEDGFKIVSHVLFFNYEGKKYEYSEPNLLVVNKDLSGNYAISHEESDKILKHTRLINKAEDLAFDLFLATGENLKWEKK